LQIIQNTEVNLLINFTKQNKHKAFINTLNYTLKILEDIKTPSAVTVVNSSLLTTFLNAETTGQ